MSCNWVDFSQVSSVEPVRFQCCEQTFIHDGGGGAPVAEGAEQRAEDEAEERTQAPGERHRHTDNAVYGIELPLCYAAETMLEALILVWFSSTRCS